MAGIDRTGPGARRALLAALGVTVLAGGVLVAVDVARPPEAAATPLLTPFDSCEELGDWYRQAALDRVADIGAAGPGGWLAGSPVALPEPLAAPEPLPAPPLPAAPPLRGDGTAVEERAGAAGPEAGQAAQAQAAEADAAAAPPAPQVGGPVDASGTGTNVQEVGVDEPAPLKTDGERAYALVEDRLVVSSLDGGVSVAGEVPLQRDAGAAGGVGEQGEAGSSPPGGGAAASTVFVPAGETFTELLLLGDRVVVLGTGWLEVPPRRGAPEPDEPGAFLPVPPGGMTTIAVTVDVSDPAAPTVVDRLEVEGRYVSARATDGAVRLVTAATPLLPWYSTWEPVLPGTRDTVDLAPAPGGAPDGGGPTLGEDEALQRNRELVAGVPDEEWLPAIVGRAPDGSVARTPAVACSAVSHPEVDAGLGTVTVLTLDPSAPAGELVRDSDAVTADGDLVYAAPERLYVATTSRGWAWGGGGPWLDAPARAGEVTTQLHGFDTTGAERTSYVGSGEVDGWLLGRWAMSAQDGTLRVAVTRHDATAGSTPDPDADGGEEPQDGPADEPLDEPVDGPVDEPAVAPVPIPVPVPATSSSIVVLTEGAGSLEEVGRVDGLGPGEEIRGVRWFGDLAVAVTFRETDPLYTVDLSDPAAPAVLGELKVTGYSAYLHPVGDDILLGIGQQASDDGMRLGAKAESYDLSDLAAPRDVDVVEWPNSHSPVEGDSRLFAFDPASRTALVPLERYDDAGQTVGAAAVTVGADGSLDTSGEWQAGGGQGTFGGMLAGVATTGDSVLVLSTFWDGSETATEPSGPAEPSGPSVELTRLSLADLTEQGSVRLD